MKRTALLLIVCLLPLLSWGQARNTTTEVKDYREVDGRIVIPVIINGFETDFILDLSSRPVMLPEYAAKSNLQMAPDPGDSKAFPYKSTKAVGSTTADDISFGNSAFARGARVFSVNDAPYLRKLNVAGVMGLSIMRNTVLTIDANRKKLTMTTPYRPMYIALNNRQDFTINNTDLTMSLDIEIDGRPVNVIFDMWSANCVELTPGDFAQVSGSKTKGLVGPDLAPAKTKAAGKVARTVKVARTELTDIPVIENKSIGKSRLGSGIFKYGIVSFDFDRGKLYFQPHGTAEIVDELPKEVTIVPGKLNPITSRWFLDNIHDYKANKEFTYKGDIPVVIDFWATWCGPCMKMMPQMEQMARKYEGKVLFLKVDADIERELCNIFKINALPTLMFITADGQMFSETGALPDKCEQTIIEKLLK